MAIAKLDIVDWLNTLPDDATVAIDEGGLQLIQLGTDEEVYLEVGGEPL